MLAWVALVFIAGCQSPDTYSDARLRIFSTQKHRQMDGLAARAHVDVPPEAHTFFKAAERGDWRAVTNAPPQLLQFTNILSVPIHETVGAYDESRRWDSGQIQRYADTILQSMPTGSVYFGGTDAGRFVITEFRDVADSPDIFIITPKYIDFASGQIFSGYMNYLRDLYGNRLTVPGDKDLPPAAAGDVQSVLSADGAISRWIFEHNKDEHPFYYEESYVCAWMYPYLEPHGLIMKLNAEPMQDLDPDVVRRDFEFWRNLSGELLADPRFLGNEWARTVYAKLRSGIAGIYTYRNMTNEAIAALNQAVKLCPTSAEPNFRLADAYIRWFYFADARVVMEKFMGLSPDEKVADYLDVIKDLQMADTRRRVLEDKVAHGGDASSQLELADVYRRMKLGYQLDSLCMRIAADTNQSPDVILKVGQMYADAKRYDMVVTVLEHYLARSPENADAWIDLAAAQLALQRKQDSIASLRRAIEAGGDAARELIRTDSRFGQLGGAQEPPGD